MEPSKNPVSLFSTADPIQRVFCVYSYSGRASQAVCRLKYSRSTGLGPPMARRLFEFYCAQGLAMPHIVLPVPIHWRRLCMRGFNQAAMLATNFPQFEDHNPLLRVRYTRPQVGLDPDQRRINMLGAFRAGEEVKGKVVLLIDDVYTTGSTAEACAIALREAGASHISVLTFAGYGGVNEP